MGVVVRCACFEVVNIEKRSFLFGSEKFGRAWHRKLLFPDFPNGNKAQLDAGGSNSLRIVI